MFLGFILILRLMLLLVLLGLLLKVEVSLTEGMRLWGEGG